jgi:hypothetical protein
MTTAAVNSILARCLLDSSFLDGVARDPDRALAGYPLDPATLAGFRSMDAARVRSFAGFMTQVRHNHLWESFPYTMALLKAHRLAVEVFSAYLPEAQAERARAESSLADRTARFVAFLSARLDARRFRRPGLRAMLSHERAVWELGIEISRRGPPPDDAPRDTEVTALTARDFGAIVPAVRGAARIDVFDHDPLAIIDMIAEGAFDAAKLRRRRLRRVYWVDARTGELRVFDLDPVLFELLRHVDGRRPIRAVVERTRPAIPRRGDRGRVRRLAPAELRPHLEALFARGLLVPATARAGDRRS